MRTTSLLIILLFFSNFIYSQVDSVLQAKDTVVIYKNQSFILSDVVVRNNFNIPAFIDYIKNDTTFYKAFRNLRVIGFSSSNDIRFTDKKGNVKAAMQSRTRQNRVNGCRTMEVLEERTMGDFYDKNHNYNYTTAGMYASLFFTKGRVCNETNIVKGTAIDAKNKSGMDKHREQLKQLFFNPGTRIAGLPFIGNKVALFDEDVAKLYDFRLDRKDYRDKLCYVFTITPRVDLTEAERNDIVIDEMTTYFNSSTLEIVARNYSLSYKAGVFSFDVDMSVEMEKFGDLLLPKTLRYKGYWDIIFKKTERCDFTATLYDYKN